MIIITQVCDGCGASRQLSVGYRGGRNTIKEAAAVGGWQEIQEFKHLCVTCYAQVISKVMDK